MGPYERRKTAAYLAFTVFFVTLSLLPLAWVLKLSVAGPQDLARVPPTILPRSFTLSSYVSVLLDPSFVRSLFNSVVIAGSTTVACLVLGAPAAYAIARLRLRFGGVVLTLILGLGFFPPVALLVPLLIQFGNLGIAGTYPAIILPDVVVTLPLTVWLLVTYFKEMPREIEDAARVDGATSFGVFGKIVAPLAAPGVFTAGVLTFVFAWNEFFFANTFAFDANTQPLTRVLSDYAASLLISDRGVLAAAAILVTLPVALLTVLFQRRLISGLTAGALDETTRPDGSSRRRYRSLPHRARGGPGARQRVHGPRPAAGASVAPRPLRDDSVPPGRQAAWRSRGGPRRKR